MSPPETTPTTLRDREPGEGLDVERLAAAMNDAQVIASEIALGHDLTVPARRIADAYGAADSDDYGYVIGALDVAWAAVEVALPEGWIFEVGNWQAEPNRPEGLALYEATAEPYEHHRRESGGMRIGRGNTPAEALLQLAGALHLVPRHD